MTPPSRTPLWAYTYEFPPQGADRLRSMKAVIEAEHSSVSEGATVWTGRLVADERITHLLVLSDSPDLTRAVNKQIEAELRALNLRYSVTVPLAVTDDDDSEPDAAV